MNAMTQTPEDGSLEQILRWCETPQPGNWIVYHNGNLAADRLADPEVGRKADVLRVFAETRFVSLAQYRPPHRDHTVYSATQTGTGYTPHSVLGGLVTPIQWWVLRAINGPFHGLSVGRVIRNTMHITSDRDAHAFLDTLTRNGWVHNTADGWKLTPLGLSLLV